MDVYIIGLLIHKGDICLSACSYVIILSTEVFQKFYGTYEADI